MGNFASHPKYYSNKEAIEILGDDTWARLRNQLEQCRGRVVDYELFAKILYCRFERMVSFDAFWSHELNVTVFSISKLNNCYQIITAEGVERVFVPSVRKRHYWQCGHE